MTGSDYRESYREHERNSWRFHVGFERFACGYCGSIVSSILGMGRPVNDSQTTRAVDVRFCTNCFHATNFLIEFSGCVTQEPRPLLGERFDPPQEKDDSVKNIVNLYDEARKALSQAAPSCSVLMFRKLLMHIAVQQKAQPNGTFLGYCDYLRDRNIVGTPQHAMLDRIRQAGNAENHQVRTATDNEAEDLLNLVTVLIQSIYFMD